MFQCSSASRKFLNMTRISSIFHAEKSFSALQRAENSSILRPVAIACARGVSVLFSEPKIPQCKRFTDETCDHDVSVLFSEPKIPQSGFACITSLRSRGFSALQRAENSSIQTRWHIRTTYSAFQCSSASRKFLNSRRAIGTQTASGVSVLFSEPKIPQLYA